MYKSRVLEKKKRGSLYFRIGLTFRVGSKKKRKSSIGQINEQEYDVVGLFMSPTFTCIKGTSFSLIPLTTSGPPFDPLRFPRHRSRPLRSRCLTTSINRVDALFSM